MKGSLFSATWLLLLCVLEFLEIMFQPLKSQPLTVILSHVPLLMQQRWWHGAVSFQGYLGLWDTWQRASEEALSLKSSDEEQCLYPTSKTKLPLLASYLKSLWWGVRPHTLLCFLINAYTLKTVVHLKPQQWGILWKQMGLSLEWRDHISPVHRRLCMHLYDANRTKE